MGRYSQLLVVFPRGQGLGIWKEALFGWRLIRDEDIKTVKGQGILGELGDGRTWFRIIKFAVPQGATDGSEADIVVCGGVHTDNHCGEEE